MKLIQIVAVDRNGAIGKEGNLPWHIPDDLKWFKSVTSGKHCIVGRKTYESLPKSVQNDPSRKFHVVSRSGLKLENVLSILSTQKESVFVIGGSEIYSQTLGVADEAWVTHVDIEVESPDAFYPLDKLKRELSIADSFLLDSEDGVKVEVIQYLRKFKSQQ